MRLFTCGYWSIVIGGSLLAVGCMNIGSRFEILPRNGVASPAASASKTGAAVFCPNYPEGPQPNPASNLTEAVPQPLPKGPSKATLGSPTSYTP